MRQAKNAIGDYQVLAETYRMTADNVHRSNRVRISIVYKVTEKILNVCFIKKLEATIL